MLKKLQNYKLLSLLILYIVVLIGFNLLYSVNLINEVFLIIMFLFNFIFFIGISYYKFNRGVHAIFIFYSMLFIFQGGLFISYLFTRDFQDISYIELQGANYNLPLNYIIETANLLFISCLIIFLTVLFSKNNIISTLTVVKKHESMANYFFALFILFLPFDIYKKISYLNYIFSHGGYLAIYTNNGEHIESVGTVIRGLSLLSNLCFYFFFIACNQKRKLLYITFCLFFPLSLLDLIMGLRGKFFVFWLVFLLFYKFKFGGKFSIKGIIIGTITVAFVSVMTAIFRENQDLLIDNPLAAFFKSQGVSFHVNVLAVSMKDMFSKYGTNYLIYPIIIGFYNHNNFSNGYLFANDLSSSLNSSAFDMGYATGSSYIAELYLFGGYLGVIVGSFFIGKLLNIINLRKSIFWSTVIFIISINLIYLPRQSYFAPLGDLLKTLPLLLVLYFSWLLYKSINKNMR